MAITIELPRDVEDVLAREWLDLPRRVLDALVVEGYREGLISHGRVGELLGIGAAETDALLVRYDALFREAEDGLDEDIATSLRFSSAATK